METKIVTVTAQEFMSDLGKQVRGEVVRLEPEGWELYQTNVVWNGNTYSALLTFKKK